MGSEGEKMKKYLALVLSMVFVLGFAASAFAIHAEIPAETTAVVGVKGTEIQIEGEVRIRGWYEDNITNTAGTANAATGRPYSGTSMAWYDQRVRLAVDVRTAPNVTGRIHLETEVDPIRGSDAYVWGKTDTAVTGGGVAAGGAKTGDRLSILEAWIAYTGTGLLGVTSGIKAGHMPLVIGAGQFYDHRRYGDDAILLFIEHAKGTEINLVTVKFSEGTITDNTNDTDAYALLLTHKLDKDNTIGANYTYVNNSDAKLSLQNIGLHAAGKLAGLGYRASADFQFGDLTSTVKARGYALTAGVNYKVDPVTLRASFAYGTGDKAGTAKNEQFLAFVGNVINYTAVYEYRVHSAAGNTGTGLANTTYYNIGLDWSPVKDLRLALDYFLLRASKATAASGYGSDKEIGSELDLKLSYRIARNLTYFINSGVLFAGDFYKAAGTGPNSDPKNAVVFHHGLTLSF